MKQKDVIQLFNKEYPTVRLLEYTGSKHLTSRELFEKGIKCCDSCGYLMPLEQTICKCGADAIVITSDHFITYQPDYVVGEVKPDTIIEYKRCATCKELLDICEFVSRRFSSKGVRFNSICHECIDLLSGNKTKPKKKAPPANRFRGATIDKKSKSKRI